MPTVAESVSTDMTDVWTLVRALTILGIWNAEVLEGGLVWTQQVRFRGHELDDWHGQRVRVLVLSGEDSTNANL